MSKSYTLEAGANGQQVLQTDGINIRGVWPCQVRMGSAGSGSLGSRIWTQVWRQAPVKHAAVGCMWPALVLSGVHPLS